MKRFFLYIFSIILSSVVFYSCSDEISDSPATPSDNHNGEVALHISALSLGNTDGSTRAKVTEDGIAGENIKSWFVVIAKDNKVERILNSQNLTSEVTSDQAYTRLENGKTSFYAFANMTKESVFGSDIKEGDAIPAEFENKVYNFNGNRPDGTITAEKQTASELFPDGIPMSCKKVVDIDNTTNSVSLELVRMVAKVRLQFRNPTNDTILVNSVRLYNITKDNVDNILLFPNDSIDKTSQRRLVNLVDTVSQNKKETYTYNVPTGYRRQLPGVGHNVEFYVNESLSHDSTFQISVTRGTIHGNDTVPSEGRANYVTDWKTISRNEIHELGLNLGKYRIDIFVRPYTAIGVAPTYDNSSEISLIRLGLYGHYDIIPRIRDVSKASTYYSLYNTRYETYTRRQTSDNPDASGRRNDDITITSLSLQLDNTNVMGERVASTGWGENPDGSGDTKHYPTVGWNGTAMVPRIECIVGNYTGTADYIITATFTEKGKTDPITITRRIRISNTYRDLSQYAKPHR